MPFLLLQPIVLLHSLSSWSLRGHYRCLYCSLAYNPYSKAFVVIVFVSTAQYVACTVISEQTYIDFAFVNVALCEFFIVFDNFHFACVIIIFIRPARCLAHFTSFLPLFVIACPWLILLTVNQSSISSSDSHDSHCKIFCHVHGPYSWSLIVLVDAIGHISFLDRVWVLASFIPSLKLYFHSLFFFLVFVLSIHFTPLSKETSKLQVIRCSAVLSGGSIM